MCDDGSDPWRRWWMWVPHMVQLCAGLLFVEVAYDVVSSCVLALGFVVSFWWGGPGCVISSFWRVTWWLLSSTKNDPWHHWSATCTTSYNGLKPFWKRQQCCLLRPFWYYFCPQALQLKWSQAWAKNSWELTFTWGPVPPFPFPLFIPLFFLGCLFFKFCMQVSPQALSLGALYFAYTSY